MFDIRNETSADIGAIRTVTGLAFATMPYSSRTEAEIIGALRAADAVKLSLVAFSNGDVIGNVVFSDVTIDGEAGWVGLGPISVKPGLQHAGIDSALIRAGLNLMRSEGALGFVLVGDPGHYHRFGFRAAPRLGYDGVPDEYVLVLSFSDEILKGAIVYHPAVGEA